MLSHLDGGLDRPASVALLGHLDSCIACRAEYKCLQTLHRDLEEIGAGIAGNVPQVDLVDTVMEAVQRTKQTRRVAAPSKHPAFRRRFAFAGWMGLAAAAVLVVCIAGYHLAQGPSATPVPSQAKVQAPHKASVPLEQVAKSPSGKDSAPSKAKFDEIKRLLTEESSLAMPGEAMAAKGGKMPDFEEISVAEILALRRTAATDSDPDARQEARATLSAWASLTEDRARVLAESPEASIEAKVGAAQALPAPEAERILLAAVQASPEDPYLRSELAKAYEAQPGKQAQATDQLLDLNRLDPNNALNQYKLASTLMRQGDTNGAAAALDHARSLESINTYAFESDASREKALEASGMSSDAARALTALTAGMNQYVALAELAGKLLDKGRHAEEQGNLSYAKTVYESVNVMGSQVSDSSVLSTQRMAGLDIQSSAIDSLFRLFTLQGAVNALQALTQQVNQLAQSYDEILKFFEGVNAFFLGNITENVLRVAADFIHQFGDLDLLDHIGNFQAAPAKP